MNKNTLEQVRNVFAIESECIREMEKYFDEDAFEKAVTLLKNAPRIGASGCGHSGILCQHFAHLMCCIELPTRFISPAEAVHGATGYLKEGDVMLFASRGGKTKELLLILIARFLDQRCLQKMENDSKRSRRGRSLRVVLVGLAVYVLLQYNVSSQRKR